MSANSSDPALRQQRILEEFMQSELADGRLFVQAVAALAQESLSELSRQSMREFQPEHIARSTPARSTRRNQRGTVNKQVPGGGVVIEGTFSVVPVSEPTNGPSASITSITSLARSVELEIADGVQAETAPVQAHAQRNLHRRFPRLLDLLATVTAWGVRAARAASAVWARAGQSGHHHNALNRHPKHCSDYQHSTTDDWRWYWYWLYTLGGPR